MRYFVTLALGTFLLTTAMAAERADERDEAALKAALNLLMPKEPEEKPPVLIVGEITALLPTLQPPKRPDGRRLGRGRAGKLTDEEMDGLYDAVMKRNSGGGTNMVEGVRASLAALALGPQVVVSPEPEKVMKEFKAKHGFPKTWLEVSLPGYSKDGRRAVVLLQKKAYSHAERQLVHAFFEKHNDEWMLLRVGSFTLPGQDGVR